MLAALHAGSKVWRGEVIKMIVFSGPVINRTGQKGEWLIRESSPAPDTLLECVSAEQSSSLSLSSSSSVRTQTARTEAAVQWYPDASPTSLHVCTHCSYVYTSTVCLHALSQPLVCMSLQQEWPSKDGGSPCGCVCTWCGRLARPSGYIKVTNGLVFTLTIDYKWLEKRKVWLCLCPTNAPPDRPLAPSPSVHYSVRGRGRGWGFVTNGNPNLTLSQTWVKHKHKHTKTNTEADTSNTHTLTPTPTHIVDSRWSSPSYCCISK